MRIIIDTDDTPAFASAGDAYHVEGWPYSHEQKYRERDDRIFRLCREGHGAASLFLKTPVNVRVVEDDGSERQATLLGYTPFDTEGVDDIVVVLHERTEAERADGDDSRGAAPDHPVIIDAFADLRLSGSERVGHDRLLFQHHSGAKLSRHHERLAIQVDRRVASDATQRKSRAAMLRHRARRIRSQFCLGGGVDQFAWPRRR